MAAASRIVLVRHGPSAYVHHKGPIDRNGVHAWRDAYDLRGIRPESEFVADGSTAVAVTHGVFRRQLSLQLRALGWADAGRVGGYDNWSTWSFASTLRGS